MQDNRENHEEDDINWNNKSPVKTNQNEYNLPNKNILLTNRSSKVTTKISKLIYDPPKQSTRAIIKNTYTYGNKTPSILVTESSPLDNDKIKISTFKARDKNKFPEKKSIESLDVTNTTNKNDEFEKKRIEREKDIEDIQKMLNQINTSCHDNNDEDDPLKITNSNNTVDDMQNVRNEPETNIPINAETSNVNVTNEISNNQIDQEKLNKNETIPKKTDLLKSPSESEMNLRRSQTDMNLRTKFLLSPQKPISSRTGTNRSKSSVNLFSRDTSKLNLERTTKKKSYDPNEARRFMKEQRKKRQQVKKEQQGSSPKNKTTTVNTGGVDKVAIKKRLADLRKNTLKILEKNVKIKEKQKSKKNEPNEGVQSNLNTVRSNKTILKPSNSKGTLNLEKPSKNNEKVKEKIVNKKIGLLRKPEDQENSFSALKDFNINKENLHFNMKTPTENSQQMDQGIRQIISDTVIFKKLPESKFEKNNKNFENHENLAKNANSSTASIAQKPISNELGDLELKIPDKKLERKVSLREKSIQVGPQSKSTPTVQKQKELPYWLKPTPVQYYPYNFIMAVRKKLEAITNPVVSDNTKQQKYFRNQQYEIRKTQETPLSYPKERKEGVRRRIANEKNFDLKINESIEQNKNLNSERELKNLNNIRTEKSKSAGCEKDNYGQSSKSISEITSNFSSISIHVPESHTISDISSIPPDLPSNKVQKSQKSFINSTKLSDQQINNNNILNTLNFIHDDDTTISSSVFSSPEKKIKKSNSSIAPELNKNVNIFTGPLSPLSVDNINKLQIKSKSNLDNINSERGTSNKFDIPKLQLNNNPKLEIIQQKKSSKSNSSCGTQKSDNLDFSQLLEDFNKSLSQVIEVNQQLKDTLKKSNQMLSPNKKNNSHKIITARTTETENYTSDFEKDISSKFHKLNSGKLNKNNNFENNKLIPKGSIQSKTDEYTSDFEEEPTSIENVENTTNNTSTNTAKSAIILSIPETQPSLLSIPEKIQSSSNSTKTTDKLDKNTNNSQVQENSKNDIQLTNTSQEFLDSIEEMSKIKTASISEHITESINKNKEEIIENVIIEEENSVKKNQEINKFSKDSLDSVTQSKSEFIKNHINNSRGDFNTNQQIDDLKSNTTSQHTESNAAPPAYVVSDNNRTKETTNSSIGSEFIAVFNRSDIELSIYSQNESSLSEATLNYSSIGMYEKLLQTETSKSDQLAALLKMREKALMDRTKGQIAWLEVQKEKYKSKGEAAQISHIKKKQRAILMKMEKEREEIKKLIQNQKSQLSARSNISDHQQLKLYSYLPKLAENISDISIRKKSTKTSDPINTTTTTTSTTITSKNNIIRGFEIQSNQNLEKILQKREEELRKRRAHVECLMEWHQRLDKEEEEVFQLERMLFEHNVVLPPPSHQQQPSKPQSDQVQYQSKKELAKLKKDKKLIEIDKSLRELQNISCKSADSTGNQNPDYVRTTGNKLNKLWSRLTGQKNIEKFDVKKRYKLYKKDLEKLYEEAKEEVLREFGKQQGMMELFEQSKCLETSANSLDGDNKIVIPKLNLNFSSGQSDIDNNTNICSVFYESTIQKQLQSIDSFENNQEQVTEFNSEKSEKIMDYANSNFVQSENEKSVHNEVSNQIIKPGQENIRNSEIETKLSSDLSVEFGPLATDITEECNLTEPNNSSTSKITKLTEISDITAENKTSDDITSLSLEEQNKSENSKTVVIDSNSSGHLKLNQPIELSPPTSKEVRSDSEESEKNLINNQILEENNTITENIVSKNVDRVSVIVSPTSITEKSCEKPLENIINSANSEINLDSITEKIPKADAQSVNTSSIEEIAKFSEETDPNFTEELSESDKLIVETNNLEVDCSDALEKSDSIKSEIEYSQKTDKNISPKKSINSEILQSPNISNNSKQIPESPQGVSADTFVLSQQNSNNSPISPNSAIEKVSQIELQKTIEEMEDYENDFSGSDMTFLEDITAPKFESTMEETKSNLEDFNLEENHDEKSYSTSELEKRLIDLDVSLKDLHNTFDRALSPDKNSTTPSPPPPLLLSPTIFNKSPPDDAIIKLDLEKTSLSQRNNYITTNENATTLMPDIINEVELRRRQQILIDSEIKQFEQNVPPYVFLQIPNKPPPPYVPPAHGSPMTIIFPSEQRIKEITFRRTNELYDEILKTDKNTDKNDTKDSTPVTSKSNSILDENITNIYERIILDICKECMQEYKKILTNLNPETYKNSLALFNPPDRLKCMQEFVYRNVRKLLSMEKKSNILQKNSIISIGRKKRDNVDEILIQELYEEEHKWTNFDQEEDEVKLAIVDEILTDIIKGVIGEVTDINQKKLEFLTNFSSVNLNKE